VELRQALDRFDDLQIVYVMAREQINPKTLRFINENGLRDRVRFLSDPESRTIDALGLRLQTPEPIEAGVAHPATYLLDREGRIQLVDVRRDFHVWLDPALIVAALERL
jgi:peroxiredoxin